MISEKSAMSKADYLGQAMSALPDGLPIDVEESTFKQIEWIVDNDMFCDVKDLRSRFKGTELKDMEKALQYMKWSVDVLHGVPIDPRKR